MEILPEEGETCDLHDDDPGLTQLLEVMYRSAKDFVGEPMMYSLLDVAKNWLEESSTGGGGQEGDLKEASVTGIFGICFLFSQNVVDTKHTRPRIYTKLKVRSHRPR